MENICFLTPHFKFIKREKIDNDELSNSSENSVDPYCYHISRCGKDSLEKLGTYKVHSVYD